jgi:hypothetical protein
LPPGIACTRMELGVIALPSAGGASRMGTAFACRNPIANSACVPLLSLPVAMKRALFLPLAGSKGLFPHLHTAHLSNAFVAAAPRANE